MARSKSLGALAVLCVLCRAASPAAAQMTGAIYGTVTDATSGVMSGVAVSLQRDAAPAQKAVTDSKGGYFFADVPTGTYRVTFWQEGFKIAVRNSVIVTTGFQARVDQRMAVATPEAYIGSPAPPSVAYDRVSHTGSTFTKDILERVPTASAQPSDVKAVLANTAKYLADYEKAFSVVVAEESYVQSLLTMVGGRMTRQERTLRSDVLETSVGQNDWIAFRDVFEVDGQKVRDRDTRLQRLFLDAPTEALTQSRRIVAESARYNLGSLQRNVNVPTMALTYLRAGNQSRSVFADAGRQDVDGVSAMMVTFVERARPTIVRSATKDLPATGRFWIEPASGKVLKSEVTILGASSPAKIAVTYAAVPKMAMWAPVLMREEYDSTDGRERIRGEARYSNFRQFTVAVGEKIKH